MSAVAQRAWKVANGLLARPRQNPATVAEIASACAQLDALQPADDADRRALAEAASALFQVAERAGA